MTKDEAINTVRQFGDAIITYRSIESNKLKYNVCTLDFSTPYIKNKVNKAREGEDTVLMFSWDADGYKLVRPATITRIEPLNSVLKERRNG